MNRRQIALKLILDKLQIAQTVDTFDDRLILQKAIYIVQQADLPLGYHYSWYLRGPYCSTVTSDAFEVFSEKAPDDWSIGAKTQKKIDSIQGLITSLIKTDSPAKEFENTASILFIVKTKQAEKTDIKKITEKMVTAGKDVTEKEVSNKLDQLKKYGLI